MSANNTKPVYPDFTTFYEEAVKPFKTANHAAIRLDNKLKGSSKTYFAYFMYQDKKWKVASDTNISKLDMAYEAIKTGTDPFVIKPTRDHKGETLNIKGQPIRDTRFYVYSA
jgi:hypothetical protein